jgi:hypothetical protein
MTKEAGTMRVHIQYGRDAAGLHTAQTPQYRGLLARGQSDAEAARVLIGLIELAEKSRGHKRTAPKEVIYADVA